MRKAHRNLIICVVVAILHVGCASHQYNRIREISLNDDEMKFYQDMYNADREKMGFSSIPLIGKVKVVKAMAYDGVKGHDMVTLLFNGRSKKAIILTNDSNQYQYAYEVELYCDPANTDHSSGSDKECVKLWYSKNTPLPNQSKFTILYFGSDPILVGKELVLDDVKPLLRKWGFIN
jgi:hypothetical protein